MISVSDEQNVKQKDSIDVTDDGIIIFSNDEHPSKNLSGIFFISPVILSDLINLKILCPNDFTEEGIVICVNDEHSEKA